MVDELVENHQQAREYVEAIDDPLVRAAVRHSLGRAIVAITNEAKGQYLKCLDRGHKIDLLLYVMLHRWNTSSEAPLNSKSSGGVASNDELT